MNILDAFGAISWVGVAVAFVAYAVLGGLWFAVLFAKPYAASLGRSSVPKDQSPLFYAGPMVATFVVVVTTGLLAAALDVGSVGAGLTLALVVGVGYLVANTVVIAINPNMPRPLFYAAISGAYHLVGITITGAVLGALA